MKLILLGYMGSGKSQVGKQLAEILSCEFLDLDDYIEIKEKCSIAEIFKARGELYFRKVESRYLKEILNSDRDLVIALGGGTPCYSNNMDLISSHEDTRSIYLTASVKELAKRLMPERRHRPLISHLKTEDELSEFIGKHLFERNPFYNRSELVVSTDNRSIADVSRQIILNLFEYSR